MSKHMGRWRVVTEPPLPSHCVCIVGADGNTTYYVEADPREHGTVQEDAAVLAAAPDLREAAKQALDALIWASAAADFQPGGRAHEVWARIGRPAIEELQAALAKSDAGLREVATP